MTFENQLYLKIMRKLLHRSNVRRVAQRDGFRLELIVLSSSTSVTNV